MARSDSTQAHRIAVAITWLALLGASTWAVIALGLCTAERVFYPFELEWMEGSMVDHAARVVDGKPIYTAPTIEHVPYLYTPLYFQAAAALSTFTGLDFAVLRLLNLLSSLGAFALLGLLVGRELRSWRAGILTATIPVAGYGFVDSWYDLARNDGLFLLLVMGSVAVARWGRRTLPLAGLFAALAFLAKQSEVFVLPGLCLATLAFGVKRAVWVGVWSAVALGVTVLVAHLWSDGWFTFYVFTMPAEHGVNGEMPLFWNDWKRGIVPLWPAALLLPIGIAAGMLGGIRPRAPLWTALAAVGVAGSWVPAVWPDPKMPALLTSVAWPATALALVWGLQPPRLGADLGDRARGGGFWLVLAVGFFAVAWISRRHAGGHVNAFIPALMSCGILAAFAVERVAERWPTPWTVPATGALAGMLFVNLTWSPSDFVPTAENRVANEQLRDWIRSVDGDVLLLSHGHLAAREGKARTAHAMAIADLYQYQDGGSEEMKAFFESVQKAGRENRFQAMALDQKFLGVARGLMAKAAEGMTVLKQPPVKPPRHMQPAVGMREAFPRLFLVRRP